MKRLQWMICIALLAQIQSTYNDALQNQRNAMGQQQMDSAYQLPTRNYQKNTGDWQGYLLAIGNLLNGVGMFSQTFRTQYSNSQVPRNGYYQNSAEDSNRSSR